MECGGEWEDIRDVGRAKFVLIKAGFFFFKQKTAYEITR